MKTKIIKEFEFLQYKDNTRKNYIEKSVFEELEKFVLENELSYLKLTMKKGYGKVLQAQNYVGVIQTKNGTTIEILPKIQNKDNEELKKLLLKMLKTLKNSPFKSFNKAYLKTTKMPLFEIFISMFLDELDKLIKKGIKKDYISKEDNLNFLRGKLKIKEQIRKNFIHKEKFFCEYDEYLNDRIENRIIKTALKFLYKKSKLNKNQKRIREFLFIFDDVSISKNIKADFEKINLNRLMKDYDNVLLWAKIFLLNESFSNYKGKHIAFALLFDMNKLFESYVYYVLRKRYKNIKFQDKKYYLIYNEQNNGKYKLVPDIVIDNGTIIMDAKWKILNQEKDISQSDLYQMYAYATKYENCKKIYLVYPKDGFIESKKYFFDKEKEKPSLEIIFFDLNEDKFYPELKVLNFI